MITFEVGKTYQTRSICDYDCIISVTVAKRSKCFITTSEGKRLRIVKESAEFGVEMVRPWGSYSMSPQISADKVVS